jgi:hypothetical protein
VGSRGPAGIREIACLELLQHRCCTDTFAIDNSDSFDSVSEKVGRGLVVLKLANGIQWVNEIRRFLPETPLVLVGYNPELRTHRRTAVSPESYVQQLVSREEAIQPSLPCV